MIFSSLTLWAVDDEAAKVSKAVKHPDFITNTVILVVVLLLAAVLFSYLQKWRKRQFERENPADQLTSFRRLYEAGELSQEEYDHIKRQMANRIRPKPGAAPTEKPNPKELPPPIDLFDYE
jgi:hypothetical protein